MTSGPLKASHIKTGFKKKVKQQNDIRQDMQDVCMAASPYEHTLIETRIHIKQSRKTHKTDAKKRNSVYVQVRVNYFKIPATHLTIVTSIIY